MTTYRARHLPTNKWLQRIDGNSQLTPDAFTASCATQFGVSGADLAVVETAWTVAECEQAASEMATGTHEGLAVTFAPRPASAPSGRAFLKNGLVPNITGATTSAKLDRIAALIVIDPALAMVINVCNTYETLTAGDHTFLRKCWARKRANGLSADEVASIEAAAPSYGITLP